VIIIIFLLWTPYAVVQGFQTELSVSVDFNAFNFYR